MEQSVSFELPEVPNTATAAKLEKSRKEIESGDYHRFKSNKDALDFLTNELK